MDARIITPELVRLPERRQDTHKGDYGRVLIVAGSVGYTGAAALAARAAVRSGAGLVFLTVPRDIYAIEAIKNDEAMVFPLSCRDGKITEAAPEEVFAPSGKYDCALIGPGLGRGDAVEAAVWGLLERLTCPVVLDADGINAVARHIDRLDGVRCPMIFTPHDGELMRLGGNLPAGDRVTEARRMAKLLGGALIMKGHRTIVAFPDGEAFINHTGNAGMAKGGSGDVLAGLLAGLVAQGLDMKTALCAGVYYHGAAGDAAARALQCQYCVTPSDILGCLPAVMR